MEKYKIEKAKAKDENTLIEISRKIFDFDFRKILGDKVVDDYLKSNLADMEIAKNIDNILMLTTKDTIIGLAIFKENTLHMFMLLPEYQHTDASQFFISEIENMKFCEFDILNAECFLQNTKANSFFEKNHWEVSHKSFDQATNWTRIGYRKKRPKNFFENYNCKK